MKRGTILAVLSMCCLCLGCSDSSEKVIPKTMSTEVKNHHGQAFSDRNPDNWVPVNKMHLYLCAFHVAKENPQFQLEAHHYCSPQSDEVHQCVIFDSKGAGAKLLGVEYIIGDEAYRGLAEEEQKYWHPHAYEILSGQLVAVDLPDQGDEALSGLIKTWGKTWHIWRDPNSVLPLGEPLLMWSVNSDGQVRGELIKKRDAQMGISTRAIRNRRRSWGYEMPQVLMPRSIDELGRQW